MRPSCCGAPAPSPLPPWWEAGSCTIGPLSITHVTLVTIVACVVIMLVLTFFTGRTKLGKAMRACSEDKGAAQLMGINVNRTISMTFAIGSALAAIAGVLLCSAYPNLIPTTGVDAWHQGLYRGGVRRHRLDPRAPFWAACCWGSSRCSPGAYVSTQLQNAIVFAVLIVVLLVKPAGLLGKTIREKV